MAELFCLCRQSRLSWRGCLFLSVCSVTQQLHSSACASCGPPFLLSDICWLWPLPGFAFGTWRECGAMSYSQVTWGISVVLNRSPVDTLMQCEVDSRNSRLTQATFSILWLKNWLVIFICGLRLLSCRWCLAVLSSCRHREYSAQCRHVCRWGTVRGGQTFAHCTCNSSGEVYTQHLQFIRLLDRVPCCPSVVDCSCLSEH